MHPVRPVLPNCRVVCSKWDWLRFYSGTGFSRESVGCHTAYLMVFKRASSRLKPVPLIVRVHPVRPIRPNCGSCAVSAICCGLNCGTGFSRESVGCHTAHFMVFMRASSRLTPVPLIDRMRPVRPMRPNCGSCAVSAICCGLNCGTGFSREGVRCHTAYLMVFMRASSRLKPVPLMVRVHSVRWVLLNGGTRLSQRDWLRFNCGTGFSREIVRCHTANVMVFMMASSRLKPVPLIVRVHSVRRVLLNGGT